MQNLKRKAENIYLEELKKIENQIGTGITYSGQLAELAHKMFGDKSRLPFRGVFASDETDKLDKENGYYIFNLDKRDEPGSHWIGVVKESPRLIDNKSTAGGILVYDSFGRKTQMIAPSIYSIGNVKDTEDDAEQKEWEENCGARTLAALKVYDDYGPAVFSWI